MTREQVLAILRQHREALANLGVKSLALFGSSVRNEADAASDVDLLVEFDRPVGLFAFLEVKEFLEGILHRPVDLGTPDSLPPAPSRPRLPGGGVCRLETGNTVCRQESRPSQANLRIEEEPCRR